MVSHRAQAGRIEVAARRSTDVARGLSDPTDPTDQSDNVTPGFLPTPSGRNPSFRNSRSIARKTDDSTASRYRRSPTTNAARESLLHSCGEHRLGSRFRTADWTAPAK